MMDTKASLEQLLDDRARIHNQIDQSEHEAKRLKKRLAKIDKKIGRLNRELGAASQIEPLARWAAQYAKTGNFNEIAASSKLKRETLRSNIRKAAKTNPQIDADYREGVRKSRILQSRKQCEEPRPSAAERDREIKRLRAAVPSPVTIGQVILGDPLPGRSALDQIKAQRACQNSEAAPNVTVRTVYANNGRINRITLPNIQISNHHSNSNASTA